MRGVTVYNLSFNFVNHVFVSWATNLAITLFLTIPFFFFFFFFFIYTFSKKKLTKKNASSAHGIQFYAQPDINSFSSSHYFSMNPCFVLSLWNGALTSKDLSSLFLMVDLTHLNLVQLVEMLKRIGSALPAIRYAWSIYS